MNTINELTEQFNIHPVNASMMIDKYKSHIGNKHGVFTIIDITYQGDGTSKYVFKCDDCNSVKIDYIGLKRLKDIGKTCKVCREKVKNEKALQKNLQKEKRAIENAIKKAEQDKIKKANIEKIEAQKQYNQSLIGTKINKLTIRSLKTIGTHTYAHCLCECGNEKDIQLSNIKNGVTKSCGCFSKECCEQNPDAKSKTKLYRRWNSMKQRCNNPNTKAYADYGARGIKVCDEWSNSFDVFEKWAFDNGFREDLGLSLDRIDVNKGYSPDNCRWTNNFIQAVNKRTPAHLQALKNRGTLETIDGVTKNRGEWLKTYGLSQATVRYRMKNMGMTFEQALKAEKVCEGNHLAALNLPKVRKQECVNLMQISSYIEANLYLAFCKLHSNFELETQVQIDEYKIDFRVKDTNVLIECDGWEYHKNNFSEDMKRQRYLTSKGYIVIRFSGREINDNADKCAYELLDMLNAINKKIN